MAARFQRMDEEEDRSRERELFERELVQKELELESLKELIGESSPFATRMSLARSPPGTPVPTVSGAIQDTQGGPTVGATKRHLCSPEEVQEAVRRRVARKVTTTAPPIGGILNTSGSIVEPVVAQTPKGPTTAANMVKSSLVAAVHASIKAIGAVCNAPNKLNIQAAFTLFAACAALTSPSSSDS
ncbi:hypothetical protein K1T71_012617 [Dendrolimus kikuchii]|uniref:Uncharacterized protein n=1 Tax=Dendrolimus kikuchii TaxID=765133 RepID=A0ACC1CJU5_9NEOP|nr:hypothetical protein K1T71_012617 [Dendrolimus kikuchii]